MFFLLFLTWILLNGRVNLEVVLTGAAVSAALTRLARKTLHLRPWGVRRLIRRLPRVFLYLVYLVWQVLLSNLAVMRRVLSPRKRQGGGQLVWFDCGLEETGTRLVLANSITLTPGTITVGLKGKRICVYALDSEFSKDLPQSGFSKRLKRWEEGDHG